MDWQEKVLAERKARLLSGEGSVYDILEYFDSYVVDTEANLKMDAHDWEEYLSDPRPFIQDLLGDFGEWTELGFDWMADRDVIDGIIEQVVNSHYSWVK